MIIQIIRDGFHDIFSRFFRLKPIRLVLYITHKCNSRCIMCNIWKNEAKKELSFDDYNTLFSNNFLNRIRYVTISGGEACLRKDLVEIISILANKSPKIKRINLATNALNSNLTISQIEKIVKVLKDKDIKLVVQISIDALDSTNDKIRGIKNASSKILTSIKQLKYIKEKYPFLNLLCICVIQPLNVAKLNENLNYFLEENLDFIFTVVTYSESYYNNLNNENIKFNKKQKEKVIRFFKDLSSHSKMNIGKQFLYYELAEMMKGKKQKRGCPMLRENLTLEANGEIVPCLNVEFLPYGNVRNNYLSNIWGNKKTLETIVNIKKKNCTKCMSAHGISILNLFLFYLKKKLKIISVKT